ncbi:hypothetical protein [Cytobacillus sp. FSL R5-0596]
MFRITLIVSVFGKKYELVAIKMGGAALMMLTITGTGRAQMYPLYLRYCG